MTFFKLENKWFIWPLFLLLMTYAVLRAWCIEPMLDELGTYYWYIQTGQLPGHGAVLDANNHILNSFVSNKFYNLFGDHFFLFRVFALSSFPIYFYACRRLILKIKTPFPTLVFISLITVHWIFDYFSLSRGYGPTLGFLMLAFCHLVEWNSTQKPKYVLFLVLCFIGILLSNLSLLIPVLLLFSYIILGFLIRFKQFSFPRTLGFIASLLLFVAFMVPTYIYLKKLKDAGALWWGSTEGLWAVTGKSLSENVLYTDNDLIKYVIIAFLLFFLVTFVINWRKARFAGFIFQSQFWLPVLLMLCLIAFEVMAKLMKVNYPMDRVGMYLVPIFILVLGVSVHAMKSLRWTLFILLWFPLSFLWKLNLNTTVFSLGDRMRTEFYQKLTDQISPTETVSMDYVQHACYAYMSRKEKVPHLAIERSPDSLSLGDYHVSWIEELTDPNYTCIYTDPISKTHLYKRKNHAKRTLILDTVISQVHSQELRIPLAELELNGKYNMVQTIVEANVRLKEYSLGLNLTHEILKKDSTPSLFQPSRFDWYFGRKLNYSFNYPNQVFRLTPEYEKLSIFMMNNDFREVWLRKIRIRVYSISAT